MVVQPMDWTHPERGGFLRLRSRMMRTKGEAAQSNALRRADLRKVYQGLNCLGKVTKNTLCTLEYRAQGTKSFSATGHSWCGTRQSFV